MDIGYIYLKFIGWLSKNMVGQRAITLTEGRLTQFFLGQRPYSVLGHRPLAPLATGLLHVQELGLIVSPRVLSLCGRP